MKSTRTIMPRSTSKPYPKLMVSMTNDAIVLFTENGKGMCVYPGTGNSIGWYHDGWIVENFVDYIGSVNLEND